jgi:hypothetical protein
MQTYRLSTHLGAEPVAAALHKLLAELAGVCGLLAADVRAADAAAGAHEQRAIAVFAGPVLSATVLASLAQVEPTGLVAAASWLLVSVSGHFAIWCCRGCCANTASAFAMGCLTHVPKHMAQWGSI